MSTRAFDPDRCRFVYYCGHCGGELDSDRQQTIDKVDVCVDCFMKWDGGDDDQPEQEGAARTA